MPLIVVKPVDQLLRRSIFGSCWALRLWPRR